MIWWETSKFRASLVLRRILFLTARSEKRRGLSSENAVWDIFKLRALLVQSGLTEHRGALQQANRIMNWSPVFSAPFCWVLSVGYCFRRAKMASNAFTFCHVIASWLTRLLEFYRRTSARLI